MMRLQNVKEKAVDIINRIVAKMPPQIKAILLKFYAKKIVFWPVTISFGLLFLTIIIGLLFGGKRPVQVVQVHPSPTPVARVTPTIAPTEDVLTPIDQKLNDLKTQINNLDAKESRLFPPTIDFNTSF